MEQIDIVDFGSQYTQLIARKVRELNIYCEIFPATTYLPTTDNLKGIILSGSPSSVHDTNRPEIDFSQFLGRVPVLGVCYGSQLFAQLHGGKVVKSTIREYGRANLSNVNGNSPLMENVPLNSQVWMSHGDTISELPPNATLVASTKDVAHASYCVEEKNFFGVQFHPEVYHSLDGKQMLHNFLVKICGCSQSWTPDSFIDQTVTQIKKTVGTNNVVLGLSGGVDSSVAAMLIHKAIGKQLHCIFIDNGLLRKDEFAQVLHQYKDLGLNVKGVDSKAAFYQKLKGITDPEEKRKKIGHAFIEVFDEEAEKIKDVKWLAQGTIYPDVIESKSVNGPSATIKSHHNVGGLPDFMKLKILEPLNQLFKDEVREVGKHIGLENNILQRHPFPGPGLAIRILGEITDEKVKLLQEADHIFISELKAWNLYTDVWQAGVILLPVQSVGVMGDERTYESVVALRAVHSTDGMTADWVHLPYDFLSHVSNQIINKIKGINRVVYDISSKPPATIEWE